MAPRLDASTQSNTSNEVIVGFALEVARAKRDKDEATGRERAILKRAKAAGVDNEQMLQALQMRKVDAEDVVKKMQTQIRYLNIIHGGVTLTQADLFGVEQRPLNKKATGAVQAWEAEERGYDCGLNGGGIEDAVYAPGTEAHANFARGFERGQTVIAERMGDNSKKADMSLTKRRGKKAAAADDSEDPPEDDARDMGGRSSNGQAGHA